MIVTSGNGRRFIFEFSRSWKISALVITVTTSQPYVPNVARVAVSRRRSSRRLMEAPWRWASCQKSVTLIQNRKRIHVSLVNRLQYVSGVRSQALTLSRIIDRAGVRNSRNGLCIVDFLLCHSMCTNTVGANAKEFLSFDCLDKKRVSESKLNIIEKVLASFSADLIVLLFILLYGYETVGNLQYQFRAQNVHRRNKQE